MSYHKPSARKLRFIENMILITFPIVLFAGCAGSDIKPETGSSLANSRSELEITSAKNVGYNESTTFPAMDSNELLVRETGDNTIADKKEAVPEINKSATDSESPQNNASVSAAEIFLPTNNIFYFDTDRHLLLDEQRKQLVEHAEYLKANPDTTLVINGHADVRGSEQYNFTLSEKRAQSVFEILVNLGVSRKQLLIKAYGELQPMHDQSNWQENRRVELDFADPVLLSAN